jgi:Superinfection immunity protein
VYKGLLLGGTGIEHDREESVMGALAYSGTLWILAFLALTVVFMLPTLIGLIRRVDRLALVFLVNVIGGLTGIGWLAAMILAFGPRRRPIAPMSSPSRAR